MVIDQTYSKINCFIPGPQEEDDKSVNAEIMQQMHRVFKHVFTRIGCFHGTFSLQTNQTANHTRPLEASTLCISEAVQGRTRMVAAAGHHHH